MFVSNDSESKSVGAAAPRVRARVLMYQCTDSQPQMVGPSCDIVNVANSERSMPVSGLLGVDNTARAAAGSAEIKTFCPPTMRHTHIMPLASVI